MTCLLTLVAGTTLKAHIYQFTPELAGSVEYRWLSLVPAAGAAQRNNLLESVLAYSF